MAADIVAKQCEEILKLNTEIARLNKIVKNVKKPPREFSKTMYKYNVLMVTLITFFSFVLMFYSGSVTYIDLTPLCYIVPGAYAELAIHTAFMIWKSKCENIHKYPDIVADVKKVEELINNV